MRSLPEKYWDRVQFHYDHFHGPFTDNIPVYDLTIERVNEDNQVFRMDAKADDADLEKEETNEEPPPLIAWVQEMEKQEPRAASRELKEQAERSRKEDKVKLFWFFVPMKPVKGAFPEQRQSIEAFLSLFKAEDFPVHSTKKYDGANSEVHKSGDRVLFYSEDGEENTDRFPGIAAAARAALARLGSSCRNRDVARWKTSPARGGHGLHPREGRAACLPRRRMRRRQGRLGAGGERL